MSLASDLCRTVLLCAVLASPAIALAAPFERYPGAQVDEHTTDAANYRLARIESGKRTRTTTIYATTDPFDKVLAFYRKRGRVFTLPGGWASPAVCPKANNYVRATSSLTVRVVWRRPNVG